MLQAIVKKGVVFGEKVPAPVVSSGCVLIKVAFSCISPGTEMTGVKSSAKPIIKRAMEQPEKIKKVINWVRSDGLLAAIRKVEGELDSGSPTGYSLSGIVIGIGAGVNNFRIGDRVSASGGGVANHAEYADVPVNLVVKIPDGLEYDNASSVALGAIALQGVRRADLKIGEYCAVFGLGILGLITLQILRSSGVRVAVLDIDNARLKIAEKLGAECCVNPAEEEPVTILQNWSGGQGVDAVLFTASTGHSEPLSQAFQMCKRKGQVILVGTAGMNIQRRDMYPKELDFKISTSYGPGRYDSGYEEDGKDYPYAYVRWTENRNMSEYLRLLKLRAVNLDGIPRKTFTIEQVGKAFESLKNEEDKPLLVFLDYGLPDEAELEKAHEFDRKIFITNQKPANKPLQIGFIGTGNFAKNFHLPNLRKLNKKFAIHAVMDSKGHRAKEIAEQNKACYATTNLDDIINDENIDLVFICTRHDTHGKMVLKVLESGKHVFVEKPLAINREELGRIKEFYQTSDSKKPLLMVGFNRRFSPYAREIKKHTDKRINPLFINYRMNAGLLPAEHWVNKSGGRIIGEACHIIDLMTFFTGSPIESISTDTISPATDYFKADDNRSIRLKYADGSLCSIDYFALGNKNFPKESMEVHFDNKTIKLDDYKSMEGYGLKLKTIQSAGSNKGHLDELEALYDSLSGACPGWPIKLEEIIQTTEATFLITDTYLDLK